MLLNGVSLMVSLRPRGGRPPQRHPLDPRLTTVVPAMPFLGIWPTILGFEGVCILGYWDLTKEFEIQIYFDKKTKKFVY